MVKFIRSYLEALCRDEHGVTLVEYGIAIALGVTVGAATLNALAGDISSAMSAVGVLMP